MTVVPGGALGFVLASVGLALVEPYGPHNALGEAHVFVYELYCSMNPLSTSTKLVPGVMSEKCVLLFVYVYESCIERPLCTKSPFVKAASTPYDRVCPALTLAVSPL